MSTETPTPRDTQTHDPETHGPGPRQDLPDAGAPDDPLVRALRRWAPAVAPPRLPAGDVGYTVEETGLGRMLVAVRTDDAVVVACSFAGDDAAADAVLARLAHRVSPRVVRAPGATDGVRRELAEYLAGERRRFEVAVDPVLAGDFQRRVLTALADVGYGRRTSYGRLAAALGRPTASRAVGAALGANPLCVLLPCHRVVAASGALTGYAGGLEVKRRLLDLEARVGAS